MFSTKFNLTDTQIAEVESGLSNLLPRFHKLVAISSVEHLFETLRLKRPEVLYLSSPTELKVYGIDDFQRFERQPPTPRGLRPWKRSLRRALRSTPAWHSAEQRIMEQRAWTRLRLCFPLNFSLQRSISTRRLFLDVAACSTDLGLKVTTATREKIEAWTEVFSRAHFFCSNRRTAFLTSPPKRKMDAIGRLHSETGHAIRYPDGTGLYFWHGVLVPEYIVLEPKKITLPRIHSELNSEVRRVMMERYGIERFLKNSHADPIHTCYLGTLYNVHFGLMQARGGWVEPDHREWIRLLMVKNSTPEPDGSFKNYFLQVPPHIRKADDAVAWTFGFSNARKYRAALQEET